MMLKSEFMREVPRLWREHKRNNPDADALLWWRRMERERPDLTYRHRSHVDLWQVIKRYLR